MAAELEDLIRVGVGRSSHPSGNLLASMQSNLREGYGLRNAGEIAHESIDDGPHILGKRHHIFAAHTAPPIVSAIFRKSFVDFFSVAS